MSDELLNHIGNGIGFLAVFLTLPGTLEILFLNLGGLIRPKTKQLPEALQPSLRVAVVVPAHNEEDGIQRTVRSLLACPGVGGQDPLVVVADNCTDATASKAREAGAKVLERSAQRHHCLHQAEHDDITRNITDHKTRLDSYPQVGWLLRCC